MEEFKEKKKEFDREFQNVLGAIAGGSSIEPITIEFEDKAVEEVFKESIENIESMCDSYNMYYIAMLLLKLMLSKKALKVYL